MTFRFVASIHYLIWLLAFRMIEDCLVYARLCDVKPISFRYSRCKLANNYTKHFLDRNELGKMNIIRRYVIQITADSTQYWFNAIEWTQSVEVILWLSSCMREKKKKHSNRKSDTTNNEINVISLPVKKKSPQNE